MRSQSGPCLYAMNTAPTYTEAGEAITPELRASLSLASLGSLAIATNVAESLITLPFPFFRLGLANAFVLLAVWRWGAGGGLAVAAIKVIIAAAALGTLLSPVFPMNGGGTFCSWLTAVAVAAASRRSPRGIILASVLGGVAHTAWQVFYLSWLTGARDSWYLFCGWGTWGAVSGAGVGLITERLWRWEKQYASNPY